MFRVSNSYAGEIHFDDSGLPIAADRSHGIGIQSISAYCEKNNAVCEYKVQDGWFTIRIVQSR